MSDFEILSVVVACLALVVSLVTWSGQRRLQREANDLQRITAALSKRQLELIEQQETAKNKAQLTLPLVKEDGSYRLVLRNIGQAEATDVELESLGKTAGDVLVVKDELQAKFPLKRLRPGEEVRLIAAVYLGSPIVFPMRLRWKNADGRPSDEEYAVSL